MIYIDCYQDYNWRNNTKLKKDHALVRRVADDHNTSTVRKQNVTFTTSTISLHLQDWNLLCTKKSDTTYELLSHYNRKTSTAYPYPRAMQINPIHFETFCMVQKVKLCICWHLPPAREEELHKSFQHLLQFIYT